MPWPKRLSSLFAQGRLAANRVHSVYASEPQPLPGSGPTDDGPWRRFITSLFYDMELALLWGVLIALCAWFAFADRPAIDAGELRLGLVGDPPPGGPQSIRHFQLVSATAREQLIPAMFKVEPTQLRVEPTMPGAAATGSVEQHALMAEPIFDPLGALIVSGLPTESRLSAGAKLSPAGGADGDWAVPFGELDNLVIELPRDRAADFRTRLDLRTRAGLKITSLTVEIREQPAETKASRSGNRAPGVKAKIRPAKAARPPVNGGKTASGRVGKSAVVKAAPIYPGDAPPSPAGAKNSKPPAPLVALPAPTLFSPAPKGTPIGASEPRFKDDPRFTTLKGLGMAPEAIPAPPLAGPVP